VAGWSETNLSSRALTFKKLTFIRIARQSTIESVLWSPRFLDAAVITVISRAARRTDELMAVVARVTHQLRAMGIQPFGATG